MPAVYQHKRIEPRSARVTARAITTPLTELQKQVIGKLPLLPVEFKR